MYVDFKITTWERVRLPDSIKDEVLKKIKSGEIRTSLDLTTLYEEAQFEGEIDGLTETMSLEENGGSSTLEVFKDNSEIIYRNGE